MVTNELRAERLHLAGAPSIPGLVFRHYAGPDDHSEMARVANLAQESHGDQEVYTAQKMDVDYANLTNSDPYRDALIAEVSGAMVAYSRVQWEDTTDGGRSYQSFGLVEPGWRRRGIGGAMLRHNEARLREISAGHETGRPRWLETWGNDRDLGNTRLVEREGYAVIRHFYEMECLHLDSAPRLPLPEGLEVRPVAEEHLRQLFAADGEAFQDHWGGVDVSEEAFRRWIGYPYFDPSLFVVAWDRDEIAGGVVNVIDLDENAKHGYARGILDSVFTRRPWRRRGLARALIGRSFDLLQERGMTSAALGVDATNPHEALELYKSSAFHIRLSYTAFRKPLDASDGRTAESPGF